MPEASPTPEPTPLDLDALSVKYRPGSYEAASYPTLATNDIRALITELRTSRKARTSLAAIADARTKQLHLHESHIQELESALRSAKSWATDPGNYTPEARLERVIVIADANLPTPEEIPSE